MSVCLPEGGFGSSRIKQACFPMGLQYVVLIAMSIRVVVGLILRCVFIVGGKVAVATWAPAGWGGDLDKASIRIGQETSPRANNNTQCPVDAQRLFLLLERSGKELASDKAG